MEKVKEQLKCPESKLSWYDKETVICKLNDKACMEEAGHICEVYEAYLEEIKEEK